MKISGVLETALHVADMRAAADFYRRLFDFPILDEQEHFCAFDVGGRSVLLLFTKGTTNVAKKIAGGIIPPHDGDGPTHFAFSISAEDLPGWEARLAAKGVAVEGRVTWSRGGQSVYFRDPDQNLLELATPGVWATY